MNTKIFNTKGKNPQTLENYQACQEAYNTQKGAKKIETNLEMTSDTTERDSKTVIIICVSLEIIKKRKKGIKTKFSKEIMAEICCIS